VSVLHRYMNRGENIAIRNRRENVIDVMNSTKRKETLVNDTKLRIQVLGQGREEKKSVNNSKLKISLMDKICYNF